MGVGVTKKPGGIGDPWRRKATSLVLGVYPCLGVEDAALGLLPPDQFLIFPCSAGHHREASALQAASSRAFGCRLGTANGRA